MYAYDEVIETLVRRFSEMKDIFEQDEDYYEDIPYVFYESEFVKFIVSCANDRKQELLIRIFDFVEDLLRNGDERVVNLIEVAVVESLFFDKDIVDKKVLEKYFGSMTMKSYQGCYEMQV